MRVTCLQESLPATREEPGLDSHVLIWGRAEATLGQPAAAEITVREDSGGTFPESEIADGQADLTLCLCITIAKPVSDRKTPYPPAPRTLCHISYSPFNRL